MAEHRPGRGFTGRDHFPTEQAAAGLGAPLLTRLAADGIAPIDVLAKLATRVRTLSTGHGRKNDGADAISVGIAALTATGLNTLVVDEAITALRALVEHRDNVVKTRTQTVNRLHVRLTRLLPAGAPRQLDAEQAVACYAPSVRGRQGHARCAGWLPSSSPRSGTSTGGSPPQRPRSATR